MLIFWNHGNCSTFDQAVYLRVPHRRYCEARWTSVAHTSGNTTTQKVTQTQQHTHILTIKLDSTHTHTQTLQYTLKNIKHTRTQHQTLKLKNTTSNSKTHTRTQEYTHTHTHTIRKNNRVKNTNSKSTKHNQSEKGPTENQTLKLENTLSNPYTLEPQAHPCWYAAAKLGSI